MAKRVFTEEERAEYREKMLDAGFDLLKQYGMTHMSVAKITEAADIGVSTFYNFFASKEEYVYEVLQYRRRKIPELIRIALNGKEKAGPAETRTYLKMMIDERYSVFPSLTPEDEKRLLEMLPEQVRPDLQKETETSIQFFQHMEGIRPDVNIYAVYQCLLNAYTGTTIYENLSFGVSPVDVVQFTGELLVSYIKNEPDASVLAGKREKASDM